MFSQRSNRSWCPVWEQWHPSSINGYYKTLDLIRKVLDLLSQIMLKKILMNWIDIRRREGMLKTDDPYTRFMELSQRND